MSTPRRSHRDRERRTGFRQLTVIPAPAAAAAVPTLSVWMLSVLAAGWL